MGRAEDEFSEFYQRHRSGLHGALVLVSRNPHIAEELGQEAFARMWARWDRVSQMKDPDGYLYRIAMNLYFDEQRRSFVRGRFFARERLLPTRQPDDLEIVEGRTVLEKAILALPSRQRAALLVTEYLGYDSASAARLLGVRPGTVRRLTSLARKHLGAYMQDEEEEANERAP